MKFQKILNIVSGCIVGVALLLCIIGCCLPSISVAVTSGTTTITNTWFLSSGGFTSTSGGTTIIVSSAVSSVLVLISFLVSSVLVFAPKENKTLQLVGVSLGLTAFIYLSYYFANVSYTMQQLIKTYAAMSSVTACTITNPGTILLLVAAICLLIGLIINLINVYFGEKIGNSIANRQQTGSLEGRLVELKSLLDKQLISQEEYDSRRQEILNGK